MLVDDVHTNTHVHTHSHIHTHPLTHVNKVLPTKSHSFHLVILVIIKAYHQCFGILSKYKKLEIYCYKKEKKMS